MGDLTRAGLLGPILLVLAAAATAAAEEGPRAARDEPPILGGEEVRVDILPSGRPDAEESVDRERAQDRFQRGARLFREALAYRREHPADRAVTEERFREAGRAFVGAAEAGVASTEVFTNAANSFYFAGDRGRAVLYYRRALAVDPANDRAREALDHLRESLPIRRRASSAGTSLIDALFFWHDERSFLWRLWTFSVLFPAAWILLAVELTRRDWPRTRWLLVVVFPLALVAMAISYLFRLRRPYAIVGTLCMVPALLLLGSLAADAWSDDPRSEAVILVEVEGRNGDGEEYSPSHSRPLPAGTEVRILERRTNAASDGEWIRVELLDGSESWLPAQTVEPVRSTFDG